MKNSSNNAITATTFVQINLWSEHTFHKALYALREYNKEQAHMLDGKPAGEVIDFEWKLPTFDQQDQTWIDVRPEQRGVIIVLTWLLT